MCGVHRLRGTPAIPRYGVGFRAFVRRGSQAAAGFKNSDVQGLGVSDLSSLVQSLT